MTYAQKDYNQTQGNNGINTIAEIGSLLTAFSNMLTLFGHSVDPLALNATFVEDGVYLHEEEEVRDKLAYSSVSAYDPTVGISATETDTCIVRIEYVSKLTDSGVSTFAVVANRDDKTIIDSYDGIVKPWSVYGEPTEFIYYRRYDAIAITPLKPVSLPVKEAPDTYVITHALQGYTQLENARSGIDGNIGVQPGEYMIYDVSDDGEFINVTATADQPGAWIAASENVRDTDVPHPSDVGEKIEVKVIPPDPLAWQKTYTPYLGVVEMIARNNAAVHDIAGEHEDRQVLAADNIPVAGEFVYDNVTYARTKNSVDQGHWYGIPVTNLDREGEDEEALDRALDHYLNSDDDELHFELGDDKLSTREKAIKFGATVDGKIEKVSKALSFGKSK